MLGKHARCSSGKSKLPSTHGQRCAYFNYFRWSIVQNSQEMCETREKNFCAVTGVGGITHTVTARVNVSGHVLEQDFHVLDAHHSVILGMYFLTNQQAVIDFQTSTITLAGKLICKFQKHAIRSSLARTVKSVFVPANLAVVFPVLLTRSYDNDCLVT